MLPIVTPVGFEIRIRRGTACLNQDLLRGMLVEMFRLPASGETAGNRSSQNQWTMPPVSKKAGV